MGCTGNGSNQLPNAPLGQCIAAMETSRLKRNWSHMFRKNHGRENPSENENNDYVWDNLRGIILFPLRNIGRRWVG